MNLKVTVNSRFSVCKLFFQDTINALTNQNTILQTQSNHDASVNSSDDEISRVSTVTHKIIGIQRKTLNIFCW